MSSTVGLRELRQGASELVRRVEAGEEIIVTVSGRPSVRLVAVKSTPWRTWDEIDDVFQGPADVDWEADRELVDAEVRDPWSPR